MEDEQPFPSQFASSQIPSTQDHVNLTIHESDDTCRTPPHHPYHQHSSDSFDLIDDPMNEYGALHLRKCSFDSFINLPNSIYGFYDLVEGCLIKREMADRDHNDIAHYLLNKAQTHPHSRNLLMQLHPTIHIPQQDNSSASQSSGSDSDSSPLNKSSTTRRVRVPDFAIGAISTKQQIQNRSPKSQKIVFTLNNPPEVVIEITSNNEKTDTIDKMKDYAYAGIPLYIIVNRNVGRKDKPGHKPKITVGTLGDGEYDVEDFVDDERVHIRYIGNVSPNELMNGTDPNAILRQNDQEQHRILEQAKQETRIVQQERDSEKRKKEEYKRKMEKYKSEKKKYRERMRRNGLSVTDSSSSESSDVAHKNKRQKS